MIDTSNRQKTQRDFLTSRIAFHEKKIDKLQWRRVDHEFIREHEWKLENWRRLLAFYDQAVAAGIKPNGYELEQNS